MDQYRRIVELIETHALEYYVSTGAPLRLFFAQPLWNSYPFPSSPFLSDQLLEEISYRCQELFLRQEHIVRHKSVEDFLGKFQQEFKGSKLSLQWLAQLWENPVEDKGGVYKHWVLE